MQDCNLGLPTIAVGDNVILCFLNIYKLYKFNLYIPINLCHILDISISRINVYFLYIHFF